ncbi:MAG: hypothetical protein M0R03_14555 [Novosphingobium sp.]|nr:hypothetical protein [Novosphingobium sp.]
MKKLDINTLISIREYLGQKIDKNRVWNKENNEINNNHYLKDFEMLKFYENELNNVLEEYYNKNIEK